MFQRRLTEEMKVLSVSEENLYREQQDFQFTSFQQVSSAPSDAQLQVGGFMWSHLPGGALIQLVETLRIVAPGLDLWLEAGFLLHSLM